jgi:hypothetical protein
MISLVDIKRKGNPNIWHPVVGTQQKLCRGNDLKPMWGFRVNLTVLYGSGHTALLPTSSPVPVHPPTSLLPLVPGGHTTSPDSRLARGTRSLHSLDAPGATGLWKCGGHS